MCLLNEDILLSVFESVECPRTRKAMRVAISAWAKQPRSAIELACKYIATVRSLAESPAILPLPIPGFAATWLSQKPSNSICTVRNPAVVFKEGDDIAPSYGYCEDRMFYPYHFFGCIDVCRGNHTFDPEEIQLAEQKKQQRKCPFYMNRYKNCSCLHDFYFRMYDRDKRSQTFKLGHIECLHMFNGVDAMQLILDEYGGEDFLKKSIAMRQEAALKHSDTEKNCKRGLVDESPLPEKRGRYS